MSQTLDGARMPSLRDKIREQAEALEWKSDKEDLESKKGRGRRIKSKSKD